MLGEIASFLEALLARGTKASALSAQDMVPASIAAVPARSDWLPSFGGQRDAFLARPEDLAPAPEQRAYSSAAWNFRQAALNATELLSVAIDVVPPRPALDVPKVAAQVRSASRPAATVRERISALFHVPDHSSTLPTTRSSRSWPTRLRRCQLSATQAHLAGPCGAEPGVARKQLDHAARVQLAIYRELPGRAELRDGT